MVISDLILLGAGHGTRFAETARTPSNKELPKQFQLLESTPVFIHALRSLASMQVFRQALVVVPKQYIQLAKQQIEKFLPDLHLPVHFIEGGARRQDSSRLAIEWLQESNPLPTRILIHDACRPFLSRELRKTIRTCLEDRAYGAWIPVVPVIETLKRVENQKVIETVDRSLVHRVQTPQIFEFSVIHSLMGRVKDLAELSFTDDAALCEYYGIPVGVFEGDVRNIKLTYDFELETLKQILAEAKKVAACESESATTFTA